MSAPDEGPTILETRDGGVVTLTLNRPVLRNPISEKEMVDAMVAVLQRLDDDMTVRAVILTGAGSAFSSGGNLRTMGRGGSLGGGIPAKTRREYRTGIQRLPMILEALEIPIIAAVNGPAIGAGCDLACMCDIRIAGESAVFSESFVKVGLVPGDGGAWLLPRVVGFARATEMALTGDSVTAVEALAMGLVTRVTPDADLMDAAMGIARKIAANPPHVVRLTKRLLREACAMNLATVLEMSASMQAMAHATEDHHEAVSAMLERRQPAFEGR